MIFGISNPSDPYTMVADDAQIACAAVLLLGNGAYGLSDDAGKTVMPVMLFADADAVAGWIAGRLGDAESYLRDNRDAIARCLETAMVMGVRERRTYEEALARIPDGPARDEYRAAVRRPPSSLNDIGARARRLADQIRDLARWEPLPAGAAAAPGTPTAPESVELMAHDDPPCRDFLDARGLCPSCGIRPDMQSTAFRTVPRERFEAMKAAGRTLLGTYRRPL